MQTATVTMDVSPRKAAPMPRNGVNAPALLETIGVVAKQTELAKFSFAPPTSGSRAPTAVPR